MAKYRKKPVVIEATQWLRNGDHPKDDCEFMQDRNGAFLSEGKMVRYFRRPDVPGDRGCDHCGRPMNDHGWIDTLEGGHVACPGDWIITGVKGETYPCKPDIFTATYDPVDRPKPTIAELEAILASEGDHAVTINPDGSISAA